MGVIYNANTKKNPLYFMPPKVGFVGFSMPPALTTGRRSSTGSGEKKDDDKLTALAGAKVATEMAEAAIDYQLQTNESKMVDWLSTGNNLYNNNREENPEYQQLLGERAMLQYNKREVKSHYKDLEKEQELFYDKFKDIAEYRNDLLLINAEKYGGNSLGFMVPDVEGWDYKHMPTIGERMTFEEQNRNVYSFNPKGEISRKNVYLPLTGYNNAATNWYNDNEFGMHTREGEGPDPKNMPKTTQDAVMYIQKYGRGNNSANLEAASRTLLSNMPTDVKMDLSSNFMDKIFHQGGLPVIPITENMPDEQKKMAERINKANKDVIAELNNRDPKTDPYRHFMSVYTKPEKLDNKNEFRRNVYTLWQAYVNDFVQNEENRLLTTTRMDGTSIEKSPWYKENEGITARTILRGWQLGDPTITNLYWLHDNAQYQNVKSNLSGSDAVLLDRYYNIAGLSNDEIIQSPGFQQRYRNVPEEQQAKYVMKYKQEQFENMKKSLTPDAWKKVEASLKSSMEGMPVDNTQIHYGSINEFHPLNAQEASESAIVGDNLAKYGAIRLYGQILKDDNVLKNMIVLETLGFLRGPDDLNKPGMPGEYYYVKAIVDETTLQEMDAAIAPGVTDKLGASRGFLSGGDNRTEEAKALGVERYIDTEIENVINSKPAEQKSRILSQYYSTYGNKTSRKKNDFYVVEVQVPILSYGETRQKTNYEFSLPINK